MIKIKVLINGQTNKICSIEVKGHANSDVYGKDLVCAAVSAVITGGANALEDLKNFEVCLEEGNAYIVSKSEVNNHDDIVLETIVTELKTIEETNNRYVNLSEIVKD